MLESMRRGQRWLTWIIVIFVGGVFAAFIGLGGPLSPGEGADAVVVLDDERLGQADFYRVRSQTEERFRETLGDQLDSKTARSFLDSQALRTLVDSAVLAHSARELGLRVSKQEVQDVIRSIAGFRDESGKFDKESFIDQVEYQYGTQRAFLQVMRDQLLQQKMLRLLYGQAQVSDGEALASALHRLQEVQIAFVALDPTQLPVGEIVADADVETYLEEHRTEIQATYDERTDEFSVPEKIRVRHILFRVEKDADEEAVNDAKAKAEEALARIEAGASMEDVALEISEDPGSKDDGGDLGFIERDDVTQALADAVFSQEIGELGGPIRSENGFHLVRAEERSEAGTQAFDEVALELAREQAEADAASRRAQNLSDELVAAIQDGRPLEAVAREQGLTLERTGMLRRRPDGFIPGLGASPEAMATAFALTTDAASSPRVFEVGGRRVLIQLLDRKPIDEEELAQQVLLERDRLLAEKRNRLAQDWVDVERETLSAEHRLIVNASAVMGI